MATREEVAALAESGDFEEGVAAGQGGGWASAEAGSLRAAVALSAEGPGGLCAWALDPRRRLTGRGLGLRLARALLGEATTAGEADAFWKGALGREHRRPEEPGYATGFLTGTLRAWQSMRPRAG